MAKKKSKSRTTIPQHHHKGSVLTPPLANIPNTKPASWRDDRLPELLWATLLVGQLPRETALITFHKIADFIYTKRDTEQIHDILHSSIETIDDSLRLQLLNVICSTPEHQQALSPLLLLNELPARASWASAINLNPTEVAWNQLMRSVALTLDHQSQESTDCRWARVICFLAAGKLQMPKQMAEEFARYPNFGDQRKIRPTIRAMEGALSGLQDVPYDWTDKFWKQCLFDTDCFDLLIEKDITPKAGTTLERVQQVRDLLVTHAIKTRTTSKADARHETVYGIGIYTIDILQELFRIGASQAISARFALRTIVECLISLAYLIHKDQAQLWNSFRVFGAGQAKLSSLKIDESSDVSFVDTKILEELANEDMWEEFLPIELGHWEKSNLRKMSEEANIKDIYDTYYSWTSTYSHGHWGALRDATYQLCGNPLHRLHRIPRSQKHSLPDVIPDAITCVNRILHVISQAYPEFPHRIT